MTDPVPELLEAFADGQQQAQEPREQMGDALDVVAEELGVQLDLLESSGVEYARALLRHELAGGPRAAPPRGMHRLISQAVRDLAIDQAYAARFYGPKIHAA